MDTKSLRSRITKSEILSPVVKAQLLEKLEEVPREKLEWILKLLEQANLSEREFERRARELIEAQDRIETQAMKAAQREAVNLIADFEAELSVLKRK